MTTSTNAKLIADHLEKLNVTLTQINAADVITALPVADRKTTLATLDELAAKIDDARNAIRPMIPADPAPATETASA